ncbi:MAG: 4-hydroxy-tetrahydrodipicolinate reductase [Pseudobdellovibrionaceae bacterium]
MKKMRVAVFGASGRMGQEIAHLVSESSTMVPALGISKDGKAPHFLKAGKKLDAKDFKEIDVLIDFSSAEIFQSAVAFAIENKIPLISGTTGISEKDFKVLKKAQESIPVLWAPNMSLGVATLVKALEALTAISNYDFQIEETHHRHKKDKPSGTALLLQQKLESVVGRKLPDPLALRGGGVFGVHQVQIMGESETLTFEHRALNRRLFAEGALIAAQWLVKQKKGLYTLQDVLKG